MSVELFPGNSLSPQQILAGTLNDPDFGAAKGVIVGIYCDDGTPIVNFSSMDACELAFLARHIQLEVDRRLMGGSER